MWRHLVAKFPTNASGATWWLNFQQMHVVTLADDDSNFNTSLKFLQRAGFVGFAPSGTSLLTSPTMDLHVKLNFVFLNFILFEDLTSMR